MYDSVLSRAREGKGLNRDDIDMLMSIDRNDMDALFDAASDVTRARFGNRVFAYGFIYFSTYCKNNCTFCHYRRSHSMGRYRKTGEEVVALSQGLEDSGVNLVDLTMGEDPLMYDNGCAELLDLVRNVDDSVDVPIMLSPGAIPQNKFKEFREAGADWFACYQETHNRRLFGSLRVDQDYDFRWNQRKWAADSGMLTEDGMMVGVGETHRDRADSIVEMGRQGCDQIRVMTFVPQNGAPMSSSLTGSMDELRTMAVMRLAYPDRLIPASLDVEGIAGLLPRLRAGANVITSIVPPNTRLAGVAQKELDIDSGKRSLPYVSGLLDEAGFRIADTNSYLRYMKERRCSV